MSCLSSSQDYVCFHTQYVLYYRLCSEEFYTGIKVISTS